MRKLPSLRLPFSKNALAAFTLIEMSVVLIIIGLMVGGILTGQDLINAATIRAQLSQIEKYNVAVRTFQNKYGYLPGDIPDPTASNFGFLARGTAPGQGDGNGIVQGNCSGNPNGNDGINQCGETIVLWVDLSSANLMDATIAALGGNYPRQWPPSMHITPATTPNINAWLPLAKLGNGNYVSIYSYNGVNYFTVSAVNDIFWYTGSASNPGITVQQAYSIDSKIDDGLPQSGNITTCYENVTIKPWEIAWAAGGSQSGASGGITYTGSNTSECYATTTATPYAPTNCYDNSYAGGAAAIQKYQLQNAGTPNCALSFKFQ